MTFVNLSSNASDSVKVDASVFVILSLTLDDKITKTLAASLTESLTLDDKITKTLAATLTESLPLDDQLAKTAIIAFTELLPLDDQLAKTATIAFTESLTLDDSLNKFAPSTFTETLSISDNVGATTIVSLTESLSLTAGLDFFIIQPPSGDATVFLGINPGGAGCSKDTFTTFQNIELGQSYNGCGQEDKLQLTSGTTDEEDYALFWLNNGGYGADAQIIGLSTGSDLNFKSKNVAGTWNIKLVEVDPSGPTVDSILATKSVSVNANAAKIVTDISSLFGVISKGKTLGFLYTFVADDTTNNTKEMKWGKVGAGKVFQVALDITFRSTATETLSLTDNVGATKGRSLIESLTLDDKLTKTVTITFTESLTLDDKIIKTLAATLTESLPLDDQLAKTSTIAFTESLPLDAQLAKTATIAFTESLTLDDKITKTLAATFTESLTLDDKLMIFLLLPQHYQLAIEFQ